MHTIYYETENESEIGFFTAFDFLYIVNICNLNFLICILCRVTYACNFVYHLNFISNVHWCQAL